MKKKICKITAIIVSAVSMLSMGMISASATSYPTHAWSVGSNDYDEKQTASSIYVRNDGNTSVYMNVYGRKMSSSTKYDVGGGVYQTYGITIPANSNRLVRQYVKEYGYYYAYVEFWSTVANSSTGVWSPDFDTSTGSFPNAN